MEYLSYWFIHYLFMDCQDRSPHILYGLFIIIVVIIRRRQREQWHMFNTICMRMTAVAWGWQQSREDDSSRVRMISRTHLLIWMIWWSGLPCRRESLLKMERKCACTSGESVHVLQRDGWHQDSDPKLSIISSWSWIYLQPMPIRL
jgi:hypothetical protein